VTCMIREARTQDYEALCPLLDEVDAYHRQALPQVYRAPDGPARSREYVLAIIASHDAALYVAEEDGQIVGLVHVLVRQAPDVPILVPRRYAVIENIVVSRAHRRRGIGRALIERAQHWAAEQGLTRVELNVWEFNEGAMAFYRELGYTTATRRMWRAL
jgi:ribosomal protein S18 acetylase RimI-like enzyme